MNETSSRIEGAHGASLVNGELLRRLGQMRLVFRPRLSSYQQGERRSSRRGSSLEFVDHREYVHGDDLRQIDWNVYGRLNQLVLKRYEDENRLHVHLILDASRSMAWGNPRKLTYACHLAAALGYTALSSADRLEVHVPGTTEDHLGPGSGRGTVTVLWQFLERVGDGAGTDSSLLAQALQAVGKRQKRALVLILSDCFDASYEQVVVVLRQRRHEVALLQILSPEELQPTLEGDFRLVDSETEDAVEVTLDRRALEAYQRRLTEWLESIRSFCQRQGANYCLVNTGKPLAQVLFRDLPEHGILR